MCKPLRGIAKTRIGIGQAPDPEAQMGDGQLPAQLFFDELFRRGGGAGLLPRLIQRDPGGVAHQPGRARAQRAVDTDFELIVTLVPVQVAGTGIVAGFYSDFAAQIPTVYRGIVMEGPGGL